MGRQSRSTPQSQARGAWNFTKATTRDSEHSSSIVPTNAGEVVQKKPAPATRSSRRGPSRTTQVWTPNAQRAFLVLLDIGAIAIALSIAMTVAPGISPRINLAAADYYATAGWAVMWLASLCFFGTYALKHTRAGSIEYKRAINATIMTGGVIGIVCYLLAYDYPRSLYAAWMLTGIVMLCTVRYARRRMMHRLHNRELFVTPVIVAGSTHHVDEVARVLLRERWLGYRIQGAVTNDAASETAAGLPVLGNLSHLPDILESTKAPVVVFAEGSFSSPVEFRRLAWQLEQSHTQLILAPTLADVSAERLEFRPVAGLPLVDVARPNAMKALTWFKRSLDIVGSAAMLLMLSPILLTAMLAVRLEDGGPILFRQRRVGLDGKEFDCLKLRSMVVDAEAKLAELEKQNEGAGVLFKMKDDPRVTRVGKFIRRYSIDELPQLWNALVGDMSLVGPRPALPKEVAQYDFDTRRRLRVRPGLTGLWQVSVRNGSTFATRAVFDERYSREISLALDVSTIIRTFQVVARCTGC